MHVRFLLVDGRKMSKSEGNFFTLRDLLLKGYKASAIRLALISVPYRHQLNFTFDGLVEATNAIERLRTFHQRLVKGSFAPGENPQLQAAAEKAQTEYMAALANDLNTAEARAPIFDLIRTANTAIDQGQLHAGDRDAILKVLASFDAVFDVIEDRDAEPTQRAIEWAERTGRLDEVAPELLARQSLSDEAMDALVAERTLAKRQRNFARADQIRNELAEKGIVIEDVKDGVRWKRKVAGPARTITKQEIVPDGSQRCSGIAGACGARVARVGDATGCLHNERAGGAGGRDHCAGPSHAH